MFITSFFTEILGISFFIVMLAATFSLITFPIRRKFKKVGMFHQCLVAAMLLLLPPHIWMSLKLEPLKAEFHKASNGYYRIRFTGEYADGRPINEADFGGSLDEIVTKRAIVLAKYQFIPYGTGQWQFTPGYGSETGMAYVYTFLPKSWYEGTVFWVLGKFRGKPVGEKEKEGFAKDLAKAPL